MIIDHTTRGFLGSFKDSLVSTLTEGYTVNIFFIELNKKKGPDKHVSDMKKRSQAYRQPGKSRFYEWRAMTKLQCGNNSYTQIELNRNWKGLQVPMGLSADWSPPKY